MKKIFVDTSFVISLFRKNDSNHNIAKKLAYLINENECYISNGILIEIITILMKRTKDLNLVETIYFYLQDNFIIINEYELEDYADDVFSVFKKYNKDTFKVSFVDCSCVVISKIFDIDYVLSFDKRFELFGEIMLFDVNDVG